MVRNAVFVVATVFALRCVDVDPQTLSNHKTTMCLVAGAIRSNIANMVQHRSPEERAHLVPPPRWPRHRLQGVYSKCHG